MKRSYSKKGRWHGAGYYREQRIRLAILLFLYFALFGWMIMGLVLAVYDNQLVTGGVPLNAWLP